MGRDGQPMTAWKYVKTLINGIARAGPVALLGWGPRDLFKRCLETVGDIVQCSIQ